MVDISTPLPILYSFRRCPYAIRARMALAVAGVTVELREVILKDKPQALLDVSPDESVPVLVLVGEPPMDDSVAIARWAFDQSYPSSWLVYSEEQAILAQQLIDENNGSFKHYLDRYKYAVRFPEHSMEFYREKVEQFLQTLNQQLNGHAFLFGNAPSLADICIFPFIRQCAFVDKEWFDRMPYTYVQQWLEYWLSSALFTSVMDKIPQWHEGDDPLIYVPSIKL